MDFILEKIKKDVLYMEYAHVNDPKTMILLDEIEDLLLKDETQAIKIINQLDLLCIEWIYSCFERMSYEFNSIDFVTCVEGLLDKFPENTGFINEVKEAREAYNVSTTFPSK